MGIKIITERIIIRGGKMIEITGVNALPREFLPEKYTINSGAVWLKTGYRSVGVGCWSNKPGIGGRNDLITVGRRYTLIEFEAAKEKIEAAGDLLKRINDELALENKDWSGTVEYNI